MNDTMDTATLLQHAPVGLAACDAAGRVVWANPALGDMLGETAETLVGRPVADLLGARAEQVDEHTQRGVVHLADGTRRWLEQHSAALPPSAGAAELCSFTDITAFESRGRARAAVAAGIDASRVDSDTGLLNRRATLQELNAQVSRSRRYGNPLSVLCVHLLGSLGSDPDLRRNVARHLRESLRWVDSAGALAAGEMVVVLPETDLTAARHVAEKLAATLREDSDCAAAAEHMVVATWAQPDDTGALLERLRVPAAA